MALGLTPKQIIEKNKYPLLNICKDWERVLLGNIIEIQNGYAFSSVYFTREEGVPLIRIRDIAVEKTENYFNGEYSDDFVVRKGDFLIGMDGDFKLSKWPGERGLLNQRVCRLRNESELYNKQFLFFVLQPYLNAIHSETSSVTVKHLSSRTIADIPIPLPPLSEQRAIVKKLESLFTCLDAGVADLKKAQQQLKIYNQAVLKKAFEGGLTKEWRIKQNNLPSNDEILALAKNERSKYYDLQLDQWEDAVKDWKSLGSVDKKPIKPSKPKEFDAVKSDELEMHDLADAVSNWSRIGNLTYKVGDIDHKMPSTVIEGIPYLSTGNIGKNGGLDFENAKRISETDYKRLALKIKPEKGDIIFPRYGTIGRNILVDIDKKFLVSYSCAIIKTLKEVYSPKFLLYYTLSPVIQKEIKRYTVETTQKNIGIASIERFICPIYSLSEQHQIIKEVESRLSVCDSIEQNIKESLEKSEALRQSILKKAFEGNLLTAKELAECKLAEDYEPASVLLERIKAEKEANKSVEKSISRKPKINMDKKEILLLLTENNNEMTVDQLWKGSIYEGDIDAFYLKLKELFEQGKISEVKNGKKVTIKLI